MQCNVLHALTNLAQGNEQRAARVAHLCASFLMAQLARNDDCTCALPAVHAACARLLACLLQHASCRAVLVLAGALEVVPRALLHCLHDPVPLHLQEQCRADLSAPGQQRDWRAARQETVVALAAAAGHLAEHKNWRRELRTSPGLLAALRELVADKAVHPSSRTAARTALRQLHSVTGLLVSLATRS